MTDQQQHPITPPLELVQKWDSECESDVDAAMHLATQAARWGADQELEACITWVAIESLEAAKELRAARRPKPPNLKEQALEAFQFISKCHPIGGPDWDIIRRALEQLDD